MPKRKKEWTVTNVMRASKSPLIKEIEKGYLKILADCRAEIDQIEETYHLELYRVLAKAYTVAWHLQHDFDDWKNFVKHPFWAQRKKKVRRDKDHDKVLRLVMIFVFNATSGARYDRAWKYARALEIYWSSDVLPEEVAEKIKGDGGIEAVYRMAVQKSPRRKLRAELRDDYYSLEEDSEPAGDDVSDDEDQHIHSEDGDDTYDEEDCNPTFDVEIDPKRLRKLLALKNGARARITVEKVGSRGGWKRFAARAVNRLV
jgi:hypothetical protein